jgi:hypothetical protein
MQQEQQRYLILLAGAPAVASRQTSTARSFAGLAADKQHAHGSCPTLLHIAVVALYNLI